MIYLDHGNITQADIDAVTKIMQAGMVSTATPQAEEFEQDVSYHLGGPYCIATNSGTAALHTALVVCGIGSGDEVILPATTFIASANAVRLTGAKPVFVDVDADTWNIDTYLMDKVLTNRTRAIIPVHLYGNPCEMLLIQDFAQEYNLFVIEDAAESLGAKYGDTFTALWGDIGCLSFNGNKTITTSGGGMVVTKDRWTAKQVRQFVNQGRDPVNGYVGWGHNYKMTGIEATLGLSQLKRLDEYLNLKHEFYWMYRDKLDAEFQAPTGRPSWWQTAIVCKDKCQKGNFQYRLAMDLGLKLPIRGIFEPIPKTPAYFDPRAYPVAERLYRCGLCLPTSTLNTVEDIERVCDVLLG